MNRSLIAAIILAVAGGTMFARAQQRSFTVTLTEAQWLYIGTLLDEQKVKDAGPVYVIIQQQVNQQIQQANSQAQNNFEKQVRERIAADEKAKADAAKPAAPVPAPAEEKKDP